MAELFRLWWCDAIFSGMYSHQTVNWARLWENRPKLNCIHCWHNPFDVTKESDLSLVLSLVKLMHLTCLNTILCIFHWHTEQKDILSITIFIYYFSLNGDVLRAWLIYSSQHGKPFFLKGNFISLQTYLRPLWYHFLLCDPCGIDICDFIIYVHVCALKQ